MCSPDLYLTPDLLSEHSLKVFSTVLYKGSGLSVYSSQETRNFVTASAAHRTNLSTESAVILVRPQSVTVASSVDIIICSPLEEKFLSCISSCIKYRLQNTVISPGTHECLRILGRSTTIFYQCITSNREIFASQHADVCPEKSCDLPQMTAVINNEKVAIKGAVTIQQCDGTPAFKVGPSTVVNVVLAPNVQKEALSTWGTTLYGFDKLSNLVQEHICKFAIECSQAPELPERQPPIGLALYGLPGCGKRTYLKYLATKFTADGDTVLKNVATFHPSAAGNLLDELRRFLSLKGSAPGSLLLLPNLETLLSRVGTGNDRSEQMTADEEDDRKLDQAVVTQFLGYLESASTNIFILATCTDVHQLYQNIGLRKLFYKKLLVALPTVSDRLKLVTQDCERHLDSMMDATVKARFAEIVISMHGYTVRDVRRVLRMSLASLKRELDVVEPWARLAELLATEVASYQPFNLTHQLTSVESLSWSEIGGYQEVKTVLQNQVEARLMGKEARETADALGLRVPRGILLHGPPGCSKTMFVRALASECRLPLIAVQSSRIFGRYVGDSERNMRRILMQARASAPAILFIDEIDLLLPSRSSGETGASEHVLSEVLTAMDGVEAQQGQLILIGATNRIDKLDSALSRAGRFELVLEVPAPDAEARLAILRLQLVKRKHEADLVSSPGFERLATEVLLGYTGAECVQVVQQAAQLAADDNTGSINLAHLYSAQLKCPPRSLATFKHQYNQNIALVSEKEACEPGTKDDASFMMKVFVLGLISQAFFLYVYSKLQ